LGDGVGEGDWPDLAGRIVTDSAGRHHQLAVRVYFEDTDFSGFVYHASYLRWCERGRSDFLRLLGNSHEELLTGADGREPSAFVVRRMELEFLRPAKIDDVLTVETRVGEIGAATLTLNQLVRRGSQPLFKAAVLVVLISLAGKPQRLSQRIRTALVT
jgi:acyl-CoA thioester hydrolase